MCLVNTRSRHRQKNARLHPQQFRNVEHLAVCASRIVDQGDGLGEPAGDDQSLNQRDGKVLGQELITHHIELGKTVLQCLYAAVRVTSADVEYRLETAPDGKIVREVMRRREGGELVQIFFGAAQVARPKAHRDRPVQHDAHRQRMAHAPGVHDRPSREFGGLNRITLQPRGSRQIVVGKELAVETVILRVGTSGARCRPKGRLMLSTGGAEVAHMMKGDPQ